MAILKITPTRANLYELQEKLKTATQGYQHLKEKQDNLIREFMKYYEKATILRKQFEEMMVHVRNHYNLASLEMNSSEIDWLLNASLDELVVDVKRHHVSGLVVPKLNYESIIQQETIGSLIRSHSQIDRIQDQFPSLRSLMIELAEIETTCIIIAKEVQSTRRRVNALEHRTIPNLGDTISYIKLRIDDQTRSQQARIMKVTKKEK